jgi:VWFA-related protein
MSENGLKNKDMHKPLRAAGLALLAAVTAFGFGLPASAQEPPREPQAQFQGEVNVNEVLLDVLVTDAKGNVIVGLDKNDFVVKEDGKPVELTGVSFYSNRKLVDSSALDQKGVQVDRVPEDRYFILFFEDQKDASAEAPRLLAQQMEATRRAHDWIREILPNDWVAVVSYDKKLKLYQDFTHDQAVLQKAISQVMRGNDDGNWPSRIRKDGGPSLFANLPQGNALRDKTTNIYDAIRLLADAGGDVVGRKNLVLFTNGFGRPDAFGQFKPDRRYYPDMVNALNDNNVAVYPVDLSPAESLRNPLADPMTQLATDTGGQYYFNFTNFKTPLRQLSEENSGYYLLSYRSEHPANKSGFQTVEVDTVNPQFRVRARKGYEYGS